MCIYAWVKYSQSRCALKLQSCSRKAVTQWLQCFGAFVEHLRHHGSDSWTAFPASAVLWQTEAIKNHVHASCSSSCPSFSLSHCLMNCYCLFPVCRPELMWRTAGSEGERENPCNATWRFPFCEEATVQLQMERKEGRCCYSSVCPPFLLFFPPFSLQTWQSSLCVWWNMSLFFPLLLNHPRATLQVWRCEDLNTPVMWQHY